MIKFSIVEDERGRRVSNGMSNQKPFGFHEFLHSAKELKWLNAEQINSYSAKLFSKKEIIFEKIPGNRDFALEIELALKNYGFKGVLTIQDGTSTISKQVS